jgi:hypothetical protein
MGRKPRRPGVCETWCSVVPFCEALYDQGRFDEAQQVIDAVDADALPDQTGIMWPLQAQLLARRGEFAAARQLAQASLSLSLPMEQANLIPQ